MEELKLLYTVLLCSAIYWAWRRKAVWFCPHSWKILRTTYVPPEFWGKDEKIHMTIPAKNHVLMSCPKCGATKLVQMLGDEL